MAEATEQEVAEYPEIEGMDMDYVTSNREDEFSTIDHESESKKFQSLYDKERARNEELARYKPIANMLEARPDAVEALQRVISGGQPIQAKHLQMTEEEFSPWKAFFDPNSESYKHVQEQVNSAVNKGVQQQMAVVQEQVFMNDLKKDLKEGYNFDDAMVEDFVKFFSTPKEDLPFETLVDVYLKTNNKSEDRSKPASSLDIVRANKQNPQTPGSMQGAGVAPRSDQDRVFDNIKKAGGIGNRLP